MQSLQSFFLYRVVKFQLARLARRNLPLPEYRLAREAAATQLFKMPKGVKIEAGQVAGCAVEWLRPEVQTGPGVLLYLHGGAYTGGSCITHRALASRLACAAKHTTLVLDYRLAPEHPFPAALDDAIAVYQELRQTDPARPIALAGDSAGAGLALAISLRDQGATPPVALALMSPWTDLALTQSTHQTKAAVDPFFPSTARLASAARLYAADTPLQHPLVSPHYAQLHGLPETLIHVGDKEALLDDSLVLAQRMHAQGSPASIKVFPGMWHVWQTLGGRMPEADRSIAGLGDFLCRQLTFMQRPRSAPIHES
jgi:acetyl esterase/lipase